MDVLFLQLGEVVVPFSTQSPLLAWAVTGKSNKYKVHQEVAEGAIHYKVFLS